MASSYHLRVAETLFNLESLDNARLLYVSSEVADASSALQRAMKQVLDREQQRRECENTHPETIALPEFGEWPPRDWLTAGEVIIKGAETAALAGDSTLNDFAFRMLTWWFLQTGSQVMEASLCRPASD